MVTEMGFLGFYDKEPYTKVGEQGLPEQMWLWCDNESAVTSAKSEEVNPKCRHFALRERRVRDEGNRIRFCPTAQQRADGLTKNVSRQIRNLLLGWGVRSTKEDESADSSEGE